MADTPQYDQSLTIALLRARDAVTALFREHVAAAGLTLQQWRVIRALAGGHELDTTTLSHRCIILPPSLSRILRFLATEQLVENVPTSDRRQRVVRLTEKGQALFDRTWVTSQEKYAAIEAAFGTDDTRQLVDTLNRLRACLQPPDTR